MVRLLCVVGTLGLLACIVWSILCFVKHRPKKKAGIGVLICLVMLYAGGSQLPDDDVVNMTDGAGRKSIAEKSDEKLDVMLNATADDDKGMPTFTISTNLPDETELMLTLSNRNNFNAQAKVIVENGTATSETFSDHSKPLSGEYTLSISMSLPQYQSDAVREVIGENGENMTGQYVEPAEISDSNIVKADFPFVFRSESMGKEQIESKLNGIVRTGYEHTSIDRISVNENGNLYSAVIALSWNQEKSPAETKESIAANSENISKEIGESLPDIEQCSVSWTIPYYSEYVAISYSYSRSESGMNQTDCIIDDVISDETYQALVRKAEEKAAAEAAAAAAAAQKATASNSGSSGNASNFNTYDIDYQTSAKYVLNTSSQKFHYPSCSSVDKIAPNNYSTSDSSRDSLISQGYDPCGRCEP